MTAPSGPILFNSSEGSDTAASGLGPSVALTGSGASTTAASVTVTGIDTTGVDEGDLLWVSSSSGRQFSIIAEIVSGTSVNCDDTFANTEASRTWAIGGKRQNVFSATSWALNDRDGAAGDAAAGMILQMESGHTETITTTSFRMRSTRVILQGDPNAATRPIINQTDGSNRSILLESNYASVRWFDMRYNSGSAAGTLGAAVRSNTASGHSIVGMKFYGATYNWYTSIEIATSDTNVDRCSIAGGFNGIMSVGNNPQVTRTTVANVTNDGIQFGTGGCRIKDCIIAGCGREGIEASGYSGASFRIVDITNLVIYDCVRDGIRFGAASSSQWSTVRVSAIIVDVGGFAINMSSGTYASFREIGFSIAHLGWLNATSGAINSGFAGLIESKIDLTTDPFAWSKTLTAVSWAFAGKTLTKVAGFAGVHVGQSVNVTGGTGVTPGLYAIASVDSDDQITLVASIAGADTADVTTEPDFNINNHAGGGAALRAATVVLP